MTYTVDLTSTCYVCGCRRGLHRYGDERCPQVGANRHRFHPVPTRTFAPLPVPAAAPLREQPAEEIA